MWHTLATLEHGHRIRQLLHNVRVERILPSEVVDGDLALRGFDRVAQLVLAEEDLFPSEECG